MKINKALRMTKKDQEKDEKKEGECLGLEASQTQRSSESELYRSKNGNKP